MNVIYDDLFLNSLCNIIEFITRDSKKKAFYFRDELLKRIDELSFMPYKFRKSLAFDDENVRDFIFKGYVIPYKIDKEKDLIIILGIYKENLPNF